MRLPLLVGANPRVCSPEHTSIITPGKWRIVGDGLVDSEFVFNTPRHSRLSVNDQFESEIYLGMQVEIVKRGSERVVSFFAERIST